MKTKVESGILPGIYPTSHVYRAGIDLAYLAPHWWIWPSQSTAPGEPPTCRLERSMPSVSGPPIGGSGQSGLRSVVALFLQVNTFEFFLALHTIAGFSRCFRCDGFIFYMRTKVKPGI